MKVLRRITSVLVTAALLMPGVSSADVDWQARSTLKPASKPIDVAVTADGKHTFILSEGGKLFIYDEESKLHDTLEVSPDMNRVAVDGVGARVFLSNGKDGSVHELILEYVAKLDYTGSAFLGNNAAPVVLAVFSDFQ
ncbi:MAG: hypothetical protein KKG47_16060 [Proteobacteria bacterium]|nr:hypothetical protein [Pseudomonadota bacterium]MBU1739591.1 hypothetical protein [Pseudomonadota bacterium]